MVTNNSANIPTGAANTILQGQGVGSACAFSTATYPATTTASQLLYSSSNNTVAGLSTANSAILATNGSGVPSITTASGNWLNTSRCAFTATLGSDVTNATGDGTAYTIAYNQTSFDQGSDFNTSTGTFTAPVGGKYMFPYIISLSNLAAGHTKAIVFIGGIQILRFNPAAIKDSDGVVMLSGCVFFTITGSSAITMQIAVYGSTKTVTVNSGVLTNQFSGALFC